MMTAQEIKREIAIRLSSRQIKNASHEAELLIFHFLSLSRTGLVGNGPFEPDGKALAALYAAVEKRYSGYPLQYILGSWEFYGYPFYVDERVLIPRPDSETLVEAVLAEYRGKENLSLLDLCCGSGCIGIALARKLQAGRALLCDNSPEALKVARKNAFLNGLEKICECIPLDALSTAPFANRFDLILCNPPYLTGEDMKNLQTEVSFEPKEALFGGTDGLTFYRRVPGNFKAALKEGGALFFEVGQGQDETVCALLREAGFSDIKTRKDLNGITRVVYGRI